MSRIFRLRKSEKGQSLVEFALVLPVLLLLIMGIIQFGLVFSAQIAVTNAAREGARAAVVGAVMDDDLDNNTKGIRTVVTDSIGRNPLLDVFLDLSLLEVTQFIEGDAIRIVVSEAQVPVIAPIPDLFTDTIKISAEASMRNEK